MTKSIAHKKRSGGEGRDWGEMSRMVLCWQLTKKPWISVGHKLKSGSRNRNTRGRKTQNTCAAGEVDVVLRGRSDL